MFETPHPNLIQSSEGFSVEVVSRVKLVYTEFGKKAEIDCEWLAGPSALIVYTDTLTHWTDPKGVKISYEDKVRIIENIRKAFRFRGVEIEVQ